MLVSTAVPLSYQLERQYYKVTYIFGRPFPTQSNAIVVCVANDLFQSSCPGDFDMTPTTVGGCSMYILCSTLSLPTGGTMLKSYIRF